VKKWTDTTGVSQDATPWKGPYWYPEIIAFFTSLCSS
jgi:hypothetical protein